MTTKRAVLLGFLGTTLDRGPKQAKRWEMWRPSVSLCQHEDFVVNRFELLHAARFETLAQLVTKDIEQVSPETEVQLRHIELGDAWDFEEVYGTLLDFARAYPWNLDEEEYFLHITTGTHVAQICMFLLAEARYIPAKLIQSSPPSGKGETAAGSYRIIELDLSRYDSIATRFHKERKDDLLFLKSGIETKNKAFNQLIERIEKVAIVSREPILLLGPTGAGKSQLARRIYELKKQRKQVSGAFVDVNCATIRGDGAMSALFGHIRGSFTGAAQSRDGHLLSANKGVLFLDEISELGADEQAMLLRAVEEKKFFPVGGDREVKSDFQLIAGSNKDLFTVSRLGHFRDDLLARINLWSFRLPGLRDRQEDIAPNIVYELERFSEKNNLKISFNKEARERFLKFASSPAAVWHANFRDLNAAVTRMATLADSGRITETLVRDEIERLQDSWSSPGDNEEKRTILDRFGLSVTEFDSLDRFDQVQLLDVLKVCNGSRSLAEAGRQLFQNSRKDKPNYNDADRLRKYLARFGVSWRASESADR